MKNSLKYFAILILIGVTVFLISQRDGDVKGVAIEKNIFEHISSQEAFDMIADEKVVLVDVRTTEEFELESLDMAVNTIDYDSLDRDIAYLLYCRTGNRSSTAFNKMKSLGFREVYNLKGGIEDWKNEGFPTV